MRLISIVYLACGIAVSTTSALAGCNLRDLRDSVRCLDKHDKNKATEIKKLQNAVKAGWDLSCIHNICAAVNSIGTVKGIDTNFGLTYTIQLPGTVVAPTSIGCDNEERCAITDGAGSIWVGNARNANVWVLVNYKLQ